MTHFWFKPKTYGYGATPVTWQGWALVFGYAAVFGVMTHLLIVEPQIARTGPTANAWALWSAGLAGLTTAMIIVAHAKTEGGWKWRWGRD